MACVGRQTTLYRYPYRFENLLTVVPSGRAPFIISSQRLMTKWRSSLNFWPPLKIMTKMLRSFLDLGIRNLETWRSLLTSQSIHSRRESIVLQGLFSSTIADEYIVYPQPHGALLTGRKSLAARGSSVGNSLFGTSPHCLITKIYLFATTTFIPAEAIIKAAYDA